MSPSPLDPAAELALVRAAQAGDHAAFAELLDAHVSHVRTLLALRSPVPQLVDELAHDTFIYAYTHLQEFAPGTSLRAWLRAIAGNLLRAAVQRHAREQVQRDKYAAWQAVELEPELPQADADEVAFLHECLARLEAPLLELVQLKYRDGHPAETIAERLRRSAVWVRVALFRVRQQLRACVEARAAEAQSC